MQKISKYFYFSVILFLFVCDRSALAQPVFDNSNSRAWADSVLKSMSYEQKIGQLFMVDAFSNKDTAHTNFIERLIREFHIGGVIFFQGGPVRQALLTNRYQALAKVPLMIGIDGEWGLSMRLDSTIRYPRQMTLGAMGNDSLIYAMAKEIGRECRRMGIHINFAPVADINNNPLNPVINSRSFGEVKEYVATYSLSYMRGLQDQGIMACGKHFPGHGNSDSDSHFTLPVINQSAQEMDSVELFPFRYLIKNGISSMMVAHLFIPAYDTAFNTASTLSKIVIDSLLRREMGFRGLIFTDALNMKGVANYFPSGLLELKALLAGNDVLLYSADVAAAWLRIHYAIQNCEIEQDAIDEKVNRILMAKYWSGLNNLQKVDTTSLVADLNTPESKYLTSKLFEQAVTIVKNENAVLPLRDLGNCNIATLVMNDTLNNPFQEMILNYSDADLYSLEKEPSAQKIDSLLKILEKYEYVIFSIHNTSVKAAQGYNVSSKAADIINYLKDKVNLITVVFGNAYCLSRLPDAHKLKSLILSYEDTGWPQYYTAQAIFGASYGKGRLPVTPVPDIKQGTGVALGNSYTRLRFSNSLELGITEQAFNKIDSLALKAISDKATPGCQVVAAWKGNIIYQKSFGRFTYDEASSAVTNTTLYDIASVTKIAATALAVMKLYEEGKIDIEKKASKYFHELKKSNKRDLVI
ncbi:MAG: serine hydrolase [Bacteroidetes bacterium]|nr:serine hydrolase [Bacteroidota bacterium]